MFKLLTWTLPLALLSLPSGAKATTAEKEARATYSLSFPLYLYTHSSTSGGAGAPPTTQVDQVRTADLSSSYLNVTVGKYALYVYPLADQKMVSASFMPNESWELGLDLGVGHKKGKHDGGQVNNDTVGIFGFYFQEFAKASVEYGFTLDFTDSVDHSTSDNADTPNNKDSRSVYGKISANVVYSLAPNLKYVTGVWVAQTNDHDQTVRATKKTVVYGANIATVRLGFD